MLLLEKILGQRQGSVLLFTRTKHGAHKIVKSIKDMGWRTAEIHSNKSMSQRKEALDGFKSGRYRVLVATDIASRGIDVSCIETVINYDLPDDIENYVHRIGRTGRAGAKGQAISFATPNQSMDVKNIEKLIKKQLPIVKHPEVPPAEFDRSGSGRSSSFRPTHRDTRFNPSQRSRPDSRSGSRPESRSGSRPDSRSDSRHGSSRPESRHGSRNDSFRGRSRGSK